MTSASISIIITVYLRVLERWGRTLSDRASLPRLNPFNPTQLMARAALLLAIVPPVGINLAEPSLAQSDFIHPDDFLEVGRDAEALLAQTVVPAADGVGTIVTPDGDQYDIDGGSLSNDGTNLFHSFEQFGLSQSQIANFLANPQLQNILGRVVGGDVSVINGLIQVTGGNANLFLLNPAGIIFGPDAQLNVSGGFTATTADGVLFDEDWYAVVGDNNYSELVGDPSGFAFTMGEPGAIINAGNLTVQPGQNLTLLGGAVASTGTLSASEGQVTVMAVPGESLVRISQTGQILALDIQPLDSSGNQLQGWQLPVAALPDLLTTGNAGYDLGLTVNSDGQVVLSVSDIPVNPGDVATSDLTAQTAVLSADQNLTLVEGQLNTTGDLTLLANDTVQVRDSSANPFVAQAGDNLLIEGIQGIDIFALNHPDSSLFSAGDMTLRSADPVIGDAYFTVGGDFRVEQLDGSLGDMLSIEDPVFEVAGDFNLANYTGASLQILAGGSVTIAGNVTINAAGGAFNDGNVTLSDGTPLSITGTTQPTLDVRAGTTGFIGTPDPGNPTGSNITIGSITINVSGGLVFLTNQYFPNTALPDGNIEVGNIDTGSAGNGGSVFIDSRGRIRAGDINASGSVVNTDGADVALIAIGDIETSEIDTTAASDSDDSNGAQSGTVTLTTAGSVQTGSINTSVSATSDLGMGEGSPDNITATAGAVSVVAGGTVTTGSVDTSANTTETFLPVESAATATAGNVTLMAGDAPGANISFVSIDASGSATGGSDNSGAGGNVQILANGGTVSGTGQITGSTDAITINTQGTSTSGTVTIVHDGGPDNDPFVVGNASINGLVGAINAGDASIAPGAADSSFPVLPNGGDAPNTPTGITITSVNTPPILTPNSISLDSQAGTPIEITLAGFLSLSDINADTTSVTVSSIPIGTLAQANGAPISAGDSVSLSDTLVYTPPGGFVGLIGTAFTVIANDGVSSSAPSTVSVNISPASPDPNSLVNQPPQVPAVVTFTSQDMCAPVNAGVAGLEEGYSSEFEEYLGRSSSQERANLTSICAGLGDVAGATGVKPALIYATFVPATLEVSWAPGQPKAEAARDDDQLELVLVSPEGQPVRKRLPEATRARVREVGRTFAREIISFQSYRYLSAAQQLYQWLVAPLQAELQAQEIQNLVFIADRGIRSLPLAALHDGEKHLVETYSVGLMPSVSLTDTSPTDLRNAQVLAVGASTFPDDPGLGDLPAAITELSIISDRLWNGEVLSNEEFTVDNLRQERAQMPFGIVHLATHAEFRPGDPSQSFIQLWDRKLRLDEVRTLGLDDPPVKLLVLSACQTAIGNSEAELGFAGLAVQAGVKSAIATLWSISDQETMFLMAEFYHQLRQAPIKAEALRQTQLALLEGQIQTDNNQLRLSNGQILELPSELGGGQSDLTHPYYWAGFTMVGSPW